MSSIYDTDEFYKVELIILTSKFNNKFYKMRCACMKKHLTSIWGQGRMRFYRIERDFIFLA